MHDDSGCSTLAGCLFILVSPAAVVSHGIAVKKVWVLACIAGIVNQDHHSLICDIDVRVVIPVSFRCHNAITDEYQFAALHGDEWNLLLRAHDLLFTIGETSFVIAALNGHGGRTHSGDFSNFNRLKVAITIAGAYTERGKLIAQIVYGQLLSWGGRRTSLKLIRGEDCHMLMQHSFNLSSRGVVRHRSDIRAVGISCWGLRCRFAAVAQAEDQK